MTRTYPPVCATLVASVVLSAAISFAAWAQPAESELFRKEVAAGKVPPMQKRLPDTPLVYPMDGPGMQPGKPGGTLNMLIGRARDVRLLVVYG